MPQQIMASSPSSPPPPASDHRGTVLSIENARQRRSRQSSSGDVIRVLLVGNHTLIRAGLRRLLDDDRGLAVVGEGADGGEAFSLVGSMRPDVVLVDVGCWDLDPVAFTCGLGGHVAVLLLSPRGPEDRVLDALRAGATGVVWNDSHPAELMSAIRTVARGDALLPPSVTRRLIAELVTSPSTTA
jgi:DNA-binding NarL/FixJ family response regulator